MSDSISKYVPLLQSACLSIALFLSLLTSSSVYVPSLFADASPVVAQSENSDRSSPRTRHQRLLRTDYIPHHPHNNPLLVESLFYSSLQNSISFETHGRDDLRQWSGQFKKGTKVMKIDFNYESSESVCRSQTRLPEGYDYSRGCILLVHTYAAYTTDYNTTFDVVDFFSDPKTVEMFDAIATEEQLSSPSSTSNSREPIIIQLSFKNRPGYQCSTSDPTVIDYEKSQVGTKAFFEILSEFHTLMQPILREKYKQTTTLLNYGRDISNQSVTTTPIPQSSSPASTLPTTTATSPSPSAPIRDGLGNLIFVFDSFNPAAATCVGNIRFWPWVSTFTGDTASASSNENGLDAFQMVNIDCLSKWWNYLGRGNFTSAISQQYEQTKLLPPPPLRLSTLATGEDSFVPFYKWNPAFSRHPSSAYLRHTFPIIYYEPSEELVIRLWIEGFSAFNYDHPGGVITAYNPDPANYHVFTAPITGRYTHTPFGANQTLTPVTTYAELTVPSIFIPTSVSAAPSVTTALQGILFTASLIKTSSTLMQVSLHQRRGRGSFQELTTTVITVSQQQLSLHTSNQEQDLDLHALLGSQLTSVVFNQAEPPTPPAPTTSSKPIGRRKRHQSSSLPPTTNTVFGELVVTGSTTSVISIRFSIDFTATPIRVPHFAQASSIVQSLGAVLSVVSTRVVIVSGLPTATNLSDAATPSVTYCWVQPHLPHYENSSLPSPNVISFAAIPLALVYDPSAHQLTMFELNQKTYSVATENDGLLLGGTSVQVASDVSSISGGFSFAASIFVKSKADPQSTLRTVVSWSLSRNVYTVVGTREIASTFNSSKTDGSSPAFSNASITSAMIFSHPAHLGVGAAPSHSFTFPSIYSVESGQSQGSHILITYGDSFCYNTVTSDDDSIEFNGIKVCDIQDWPFFELTRCEVQSYVFGDFEEYSKHVEAFASNPIWRGKAKAMVSGKIDPQTERRIIRDSFSSRHTAAKGNVESEDLIFSPKRTMQILKNEAAMKALPYLFETTQHQLTGQQSLQIETEQQLPPVNGFATACSENLLMGNFDILFNASSLLLPRDPAFDTDVRYGGFVAIVTGTSLTDISLSECGNPLPHHGQAILDSFPIYGFFRKNASSLHVPKQ